MPEGQRAEILRLADAFEDAFKVNRASRSTGPAKVQFSRTQALEVLVKTGIFLIGKEYRP
jgi:hypothetical protein